MELSRNSIKRSLSKDGRILREPDSNSSRASRKP